MGELTVRVKYEADLAKIPFGNILHKDVDHTKRGHTGVYVNYEASDWNYRSFLVWLQDHIPEYALTYSELASLNPRNMASLNVKAARLVHDRDKKIVKKGEIGELILHGLIRDVYGTEPLITKIYYKSHTTENVKGFDCVHAIFNDETQEIESLWLGEAKFWTKAEGAINSAFKSVKGFLDAKKMQKEFLTVRNHLDDKDPAKQHAEKLLSEHTSLDEIRAKLCVPVMIAYESEATGKHTKVDATFLAAIEAELQENIDTFLKKFKLEEDVDVDIHVFFLPLHNKDKTVEMFKDHIDSLQGSKAIY